MTKYDKYRLINLNEELLSQPCVIQIFLIFPSCSHGRKTTTAEDGLLMVKFIYYIKAHLFSLKTQASKRK